MAGAGGIQILRMHIALQMPFRALSDRIRLRRTVVAHFLEHMSNDFTAIGATPEETRHREAVDRRPGDLVGKEILSACKLHELRQATGISEYVGQPYHLRRLTAHGLDTLLT